MKIKSVAIAILASFTICGFATAAAPAAAGKTPQPKVLARVDDAVLTDQDLDAQVKLRFALEGIRSRRVRNPERLRSQLRRSAARHFVERELFLKYARIASLEPTVEERAEFLDSVARQHKVKSIGEIYAKLPPDLVELFKADLEKSLVATVANNRMRKATPSAVTDEEVQEMFDKIALMNSVAAATNELVYARATNVWMRLERGEMTFAEAAEDYSEAEDETTTAGEWGSFSMRDLDILGNEQALIDRLPKMKAGDITDPIESDNGLAIIMLVGVHREPTGMGQGETAMYQLSRVFFRLPMFTDVPTFAELKESLSKHKVDTAVQRKLQRLAEASRIEGIDVKRGAK